MLIWPDHTIAETPGAVEQAHGRDRRACVHRRQLGERQQAGDRRYQGSGRGDADGSSPPRHSRLGRSQPLDETRVPNLVHLSTDLQPGSLRLRHDEPCGPRIGADDRWGSYGTARIPQDERGSLQVMVNATYQGRLATGARFEETIAMAGLLAATREGAKNAERPDGCPPTPTNRPTPGARPPSGSPSGRRACWSSATRTATPCWS